MAILGIDFGRKRVGVALSDPCGVLAHPLCTLDGRDRDGLLEALARLVREHRVERIVVGLPRNMDGSLGPQARRSRKFAGRLARALGLPVDLEDERLTTEQARRAARHAGSRPSKERLDQLAATLILQGYLDRASRPSGHGLPGWRVPAGESRNDRWL